ncbi:hypothetical protein FOXYSP1_16298 [Fusarium oxysporum f. sp. phaseoli]
MSYHQSPYDAASLKSSPRTGKSAFCLDGKAVKILHKIECLNHNLCLIRRQLDVNTRDLEKIHFYRTKAKLRWFGQLCRRLNEQLDYQIRTKLLIIPILLNRKVIARREARRAKLQTYFEARIQWKSKKDEQDYRDWLGDVKRRRDVKNIWKMEQKRGTRKGGRGSSRSFIEQGSEDKGFEGTSRVMGLFASITESPWLQLWWFACFGRIVAFGGCLMFVDRQGKHDIPTRFGRIDMVRLGNN